MTARLRYREWAECEVPADLAAIADALALVEEHLTARGLPAEIWRELQLAVAEALNNAVEHGCRAHPGGSVSLRWQWSPDRIEFTVRDPGRFVPGPDWKTLPEDPLAERGRGGFLIGSIMEEATHANDRDGHALVMRKKLAVSPRPTADAATAERELALMTRELGDTYESLTALLSLTELLAASSNFQTFLREMLVRLRSIVRADDAHAWFIGADERWTLGEVAGEGVTPVPFARVPSALTLEVFRTKRERAIENVATLPADDPLRVMNGGGFLRAVTFHAQTFGVLVVARRDGEFFSAREINLIRTVADFVAIVRAISELQQQREAQLRSARELEIAAEIQQLLLPRNFPQTRAFHLHGVCVSAQAVGGDYFDVVEGPDQSVLVVIADVMGKGLSAALVATIFRSAVRARLDLADRPGLLLTEVNRQLAEDLSALDMFITAQLAFFDANFQRVLLANAGHCAALRLGRGPAAPISAADGPPLGVVAGTIYGTKHHSLVPGDTLLFVTDGVYEVENEKGELLGMDGLAHLTDEHWKDDPRRLCDDLLEAINRRAAGGRAQDDRTLVAVQARFTP